ncbi:plasmid mobilization protein [Alloacidobacterium sp.]|uniref:plasmid mobilization protein n=1 Tax=Alloacidobacterium sp. TaxID=2951999 RepID=UPI002D3DB2A6|nr:hypothetical protein [Alloacidobacterium sp.]HYK37745.1 hypothetical protein [Alloacidobacterium sp.]
MSTQPPIEDINAIVNRFQSWAGAQSSSGAKDGVRELIYDEAIRRIQRRQRSGKPLPKAEELAPVAAQSVKHRKTAKSAKPKKRTGTTRQTKREQRGGPREAVAATVPEPPAFGQVLTEKVSILPAVAPKELAIAERKTTALSLRLSLAEHGVLKKRAAEANLSVSSYLRNCVFEGEELRARIDHLLAAKQVPKLLPSRGGITDRIANFFSGMFGGRKSAFSLRA